MAQRVWPIPVVPVLLNTYYPPNAPSAARCYDIGRKLREAIAESKTLQCFAGLSESVVPIRLGETVVAYLQTGQVMTRPPTEHGFRAALAELARWRATVDVELLRQAYFETRVLPRARYQAALRLLASFAQHLSLLSNELMIRSTAAEPPAAARARAYIAEHLGEPLSLEQVARAANMSAFYFCKVFKGATGLTFTHYVARARIERTKQMLLNPHTRISEALRTLCGTFRGLQRRLRSRCRRFNRRNAAGEGWADSAENDETRMTRDQSRTGRAMQQMA